MGRRAPGLRPGALALACLGLGCGVVEAAPCRGAEPPGVRLGLVEGGEGGGFRELVDRERMTPHASPQGGFGVILYVETDGLAAGEPHTIGIAIEIRDEAGGVGWFELDEAPLSCAADSSGLYGGLLARFDPDRFATLDELAVLDEQLLSLRAHVVDADGIGAQTSREIVLDVDGGAASRR